MKKVIVILTAGLILSLGATGCIESKNPETGEKTYQVDPTVVEKVEKGVETGIGALTAVSAIWPEIISLGFLTTLGGILGTWRKMKPKLTEAQSKAKMFHSAGQVTAIGLEEFKKAYPKEWESVTDYLDNAKNDLLNPEDRLRIENLIRGFIGKAPKE